MVSSSSISATASVEEVPLYASSSVEEVPLYAPSEADYDYVDSEGGLLIASPSVPTQPHRQPSELLFPEPVLENVYKAWKPVNHGHPLRDATLFYAPPSLERVSIGGPQPDPLYEAREAGWMDGQLEKETRT